MAGPAATGVTSVLSGLSAALGALTPGQSLLLGKHLTSSDYAKAMQTLQNMLVNPAAASAYLPSLAILTDLPPQVMTYVSAALASPATYSQSINQAIAALQEVFSSESTLQQAFGL